MRFRTVFAAALLAGVASLPAHGQAPAGGDFTRWEGRWYEVARLPNYWERKCGSEVVATVLRRTDREISVIHQCRTPEGKWDVAVSQGRFTEGAPKESLGVAFTPYWYTVPPFTWGEFYAIALDIDARYALFGTADKDKLWILSQTRTIDEAVFQRAVDRAAALGYDTAKLVRTGR